MINLDKIKNQNWSNTKISILGAGKSGLAAANLCGKIGADPFISELNDSPLVKQSVIQYEYELGGHTDKVLDSELLVISPGIPDDIDIVRKCKNNGIPIVSEIEFASWFTESPIIAVTGSNGKSTTVNLIHQMFKTAGKKSLLGGNFDIPFSELVLEEFNHPNTELTFILEVSSFQLEHIYHFNPLISVILNISPDHLDRYDSMESYLRAKLNIAKNLREPGWLIYNSGDILLSNQLHDYDRVLPFSRNYCHQALLSLNETKVYSGDPTNKNVLFYLKEIKLPGDHNLENILAAGTAALKYGIDGNKIRNAIGNFTSLPHRMEFVSQVGGVTIYNDSKATNLSSAISAINCIPEKLILILGGQDKGDTDFTSLLPYLMTKTKTVISYGNGGEKIKNDLQHAISVNYFPNFGEAVTKALDISKSGDTILLAPACASFDQFDNYEDRGNCFKSIILDHLKIK